MIFREAFLFWLEAAYIFKNGSLDSKPLEIDFLEAALFPAASKNRIYIVKFEFFKRPKQKI